MQKLTDKEEIFDRLIANRFNFDYDRENDTITFRQAADRENSDLEFFGYHYCGCFENYIIHLDELETTIQDLIYEAVEFYDRRINEKINSVMEKAKNQLQDWFNI